MRRTDAALALVMLGTLAAGTHEALDGSELCGGEGDLHDVHL